jgi:nickel transport protein
MLGAVYARLLAAVPLACLVLVGASSSHEIWLQRQGETLTLLYGHTGTTHGEAEIKAYSPEEVLDIACFDLSGDTMTVAVDSGYPVQITGNAAVTYVLMSSGYWSRTPFGTRRLPKSEAKSPISSWLSYESVKRVDGWSDDLKQPMTDDLEITPLKNPLELTEGKKMRLLVTLQGRPLAGVPVAYAGEVRGISDSKGRVNIKAKHGGLQLIQASYSEPADSVKTDEIVYTTTLVFEIGDKK